MTNIILTVINLQLLIQYEAKKKKVSVTYMYYKVPVYYYVFKHARIPRCVCVMQA